ncbi:hypothetical protein B0H14DRAFT_841827 [Mycena olivaceomarginata]|nr:hypothetical protein B0H14DRAFT_841827 [Mycena olivaceomarginata]
MRTRGRGGKRNCVCASQDRSVVGTCACAAGRWGWVRASGARGSALPARPSPSPELRQPSCAPRGSHSRRPYWPRRMYMSFRGGVGLSRDALARASVRPIAIFSFQRMPVRNGVCCVGEQGWTNAGRGGRSPLRARPSRLRWLHTIIDAAASCIGGIAERPRGGARDGLRSAAPAMVRRAGMWVGRVRWCASSCEAHGAASG